MKKHKSMLWQVIAAFVSFGVMSLYLKDIFVSICLFLIILLHELGHLLMAKRLKFMTKGILMLPFGGITYAGKENSTAFEEFLISLAGPLSGLPLIIILNLLAYFTHYNRLYNISLVVGGINLINLFPILILDGGNIVKKMLGSLKFVQRSIISYGLSIFLSTVLYFEGTLTSFAGLTFIFTGMTFAADYYSFKHTPEKLLVKFPMNKKQLLMSAAMYFALSLIFMLNTKFLMIKLHF